MKTDPKLFGG